MFLTLQAADAAPELSRSFTMTPLSPLSPIKKGSTLATKPEATKETCTTVAIRCMKLGEYLGQLRKIPTATAELDNQEELDLALRTVRYVNKKIQNAYKILINSQLKTTLRQHTGITDLHHVSNHIEQFSNKWFSCFEDFNTVIQYSLAQLKASYDAITNFKRAAAEVGVPFYPQSFSQNEIIAYEIYSIYLSVSAD